MVAANLVDKVVDAIAKAARTAETGDGEIIVTSIDRRTGIHTDKTDFEAK